MKSSDRDRSDTERSKFVVAVKTKFPLTDSWWWQGCVFRAWIPPSANRCRECESALGKPKKLVDRSRWFEDGQTVLRAAVAAQANAEPELTQTKTSA